MVHTDTIIIDKLYGYKDKQYSITMCFLKQNERKQLNKSHRKFETVIRTQHIQRWSCCIKHV